jgi:beta-glucosidase-like glycosyl hydrolase
LTYYCFYDNISLIQLNKVTVTLSFQGVIMSELLDISSQDEDHADAGDDARSANAKSQANWQRRQRDKIAAAAARIAELEAALAAETERRLQLEEALLQAKEQTAAAETARAQEQQAAAADKLAAGEAVLQLKEELLELKTKLAEARLAAREAARQSGKPVARRHK